MTLSGREAGGNATISTAPCCAHAVVPDAKPRFSHLSGKTVPDILTQVLGQYQVKIDNRLSYDYRIWGVLRWYPESDFDPVV